jgi:hypothetical protein
MITYVCSRINIFVLCHYVIDFSKLNVILVTSMLTVLMMIMQLVLLRYWCLSVVWYSEKSTMFCKLCFHHQVKGWVVPTRFSLLKKSYRSSSQKTVLFSEYQMRETVQKPSYCSTSPVYISPVLVHSHIIRDLWETEYVAF